MRTNSGRWRLAVDIGGTFTDVVLADDDGTRQLIEKVLTTPKDPATGVMEGIGQVLRRGDVSPGEIRYIIHGTTLVTNALIERTGARTALVTTAGHEDALEIGREARYDTYDVLIERPEPVVPPRLRFGVRERTLSDGTKLLPIAERELGEVARQLVEAGAQAVAVSFLHSYRDPAHEEAAERVLASRLPGVPISLSSRVVREIREYERTSTTVANAYVVGVVEQYLRALLAQLQGAGFVGELLLMLSSGGTCTLTTACEVPIRLVESGPAGGAAAAADYARNGGAPRLLSFDMGGTTAKICFIDDGEPQVTRETEVARVWRFKRGSGLPIIVPVIELIEIGAGGGSVAHVGNMGLPKVGPESAGSEPGPACYGRGGARPTVTDANLVLGYLAPEYFLGGAMALDRAASEQSIREHIADPLGIDIVEAAWGIHAIVTENMANVALVHAAERGKDVGSYDLYAYGGAGPMHACSIGDRLGVTNVIIPPGAGVRSCFGFLAAPLAFEVARSHLIPLDRCDWAIVADLLASLEQEARVPLTRAGAADGAMIRRWCEMRFQGQGYEIEVALPADPPGTAWHEEVRRRFEQTYQRLYRHVPEGLAIEAVTWRVRAQAPSPPLPPVPAGAGRSGPEKGTRGIYLAARGGFDTVPVYDRYALPPGFVASGPAIIEEIESTTVVTERFEITVDEQRNLVLKRRGDVSR